MKADDCGDTAADENGDSETHNSDDGGTEASSTDRPEIGIRAYEPGDTRALWALKERFERELGALGGDDKGAKYDGKLTDEYETRYREWVDRCREREPGCVLVAESHTSDRGENGDRRLAGYVFVLPESFSLIWDAAAINELYVREPFRGTGVADALMDGALSHARKQELPLERIVLDVDGGNDRAGAFYRRRGFENWGEMVAREL